MLGSNPRSLYKHVFPPAYRGQVAFLGFARPAFGSLPPTAEMQVHPHKDSVYNQRQKQAVHLLPPSPFLPN